MSGYPEHDKLDKVAKYSQKIGEFMEWAYEKDYLRTGDRYHNIPKILAKFFEIDENILEAEKRHMIKVCRGEAELPKQPTQDEIFNPVQEEAANDQDGT